MLGKAIAACIVGACALSPFAPSAMAGEVVVRVTGVRAAGGSIGCVLFPSMAGFPMEGVNVPMVWLQASDGAVCRFGDVPAGVYAIAVVHDLNGNQRVDTNFVGIPTEPWGVSNNVRPLMRAPKFDEAAIRVAPDQTLTVDVKIAK